MGGILPREKCSGVRRDDVRAIRHAPFLTYIETAKVQLGNDIAAERRTAFALPIQPERRRTGEATGLDPEVTLNAAAQEPEAFEFVECRLHRLTIAEPQPVRRIDLRQEQLPVTRRARVYRRELDQ